MLSGRDCAGVTWPRRLRDVPATARPTRPDTEMSSARHTPVTRARVYRSRGGSSHGEPPTLHHRRGGRRRSRRRARVAPRARLRADVRRLAPGRALGSAERRCDAVDRGDLERDRSAGADARGVLHRRAVRRRPAPGRPGRAARHGLHGEGRPVGSSARSGHLLPRRLPGPRRPQDPERAGRRSASHRTGRGARRELRVVGRHRGPGLGHQHRVGRHEALRDHAPPHPGFLRAFRRHDLCRQPAQGRGGAAGRGRLEKSDDSGEGEGGRDARRVPRQLQVQPDGRRTSGASAPRSPSTSSGTTTRSPTTGSTSGSWKTTATR